MLKGNENSSAYAGHQPLATDLLLLCLTREVERAMTQDARRARFNGSDSAGWQLLTSWDFGLLWWGQVTSQIGEALYKVALLWFVYDLTGSALKMTFIGLLQTLPPLVFGPLIGVYLDRLPKQAVMIWVDLLRTVIVVLIPGLYALDLLTLERLYLLVFLLSVVSTVFGPALVAAVPLLVKPSQLVPANALIQGTYHLGLLFGPAISGAGVAFFGAQHVLYVTGATFLISAFCLLAIRVEELPQGTTALPLEGILHELLAGFRFVFMYDRTVCNLVMISVLYHLGASALVFLLPVYSREQLGVGPAQLGWLWSGLGLGMLLSSAWLAWLQQSDIPCRLRMVARAMMVGGLAVCGLSLLQTPLPAAALLVVIGGSTAVFNPVVWALLQEITPARLMGRVFTTFSTGSMASAMAGMMSFGWAADAVGPAASLAGLGLILLGSAGVAVRCSHRPAPASESR